MQKEIACEHDEVMATLAGFIQTEIVSQTEINLQPDDDLLESSLVDSLGIMRLVTFIESNFHVALPAADVTIQNFQTVRAITDYLVPKLTEDVD